MLGFTPFAKAPFAALGSGLTGTAGSLSIGGNAATSTTTTNAVNLITTNFSVLQVVSSLVFKYNGVDIATLSSTGVFQASTITAG